MQVNSQLGEFTLKKHQMGMLDERFATHPDLVYVLGNLYKKQVGRGGGREGQHRAGTRQALRLEAPSRQELLDFR